MTQLAAPRSLALALAAATLVALAWLASLRTPIDQVFADEGTYLAMVESLTTDGDLVFAEADRLRVQGSAERGRQEVILQRTDDGRITYSKPIVYPLLAAPFYAVGGRAGLIAVNLLALFGTLWLAGRYLRRLAARDGVETGLADLLLVTFAGAAAILPYAFWRMGDLLQWCCALSGLILCLQRSRLGLDAEDRRLTRGEIAGCLLLALLVALRITNGLIAVLPLAVAAAQFRWRRAVQLAAALGLGLLLVGGLSELLIGGFNPYREIRTGFMPETGYPTALEAPAEKERFDEYRRSHATEIAHPAKPRQVGFSALYFLIGRHSGLLFYYPAAALLILLALRRNDRLGWVALAAFAGTAAFFVGWKPENYFGGATFIGNRYLLSFYPALLLALPRLPSLRLLLLPWLVALPVYASAIYSERIAGPLDHGTQGHAYAGLLRVLPFETTAQFLDGVRDRYWSGQLARFVDPYAEVYSVNFALFADRPAAELELAQWEIPSGLRFFVATDAADAQLVVEDWKQRQVFPVGQGVARTPLGVPVDVRPARGWRRHFFWFADRPYYVRSLRLALESPDPHARATLTFFGDPLLLEQMVNTHLLGAEWPAPPVAGRRSDVKLRLENRGSRSWEPEDPATVTARWRLYRPGVDGAPPLKIAESGRIPLPRVELLTPVEVAIPVDWPAEPGDYLLEIDLVLEHITWFQDRTGRPLYRQPVHVAPP